MIHKNINNCCLNIHFYKGVNMILFTSDGRWKNHARQGIGEVSKCPVQNVRMLLVLGSEDKLVQYTNALFSW